MDRTVKVQRVRAAEDRKYTAHAGKLGSGENDPSEEPVCLFSKDVTTFVTRQGGNRKERTGIYRLNRTLQNLDIAN